MASCLALSSVAVEYNAKSLLYFECFIERGAAYVCDNKFEYMEEWECIGLGEYV